LDEAVAKSRDSLQDWWGERVGCLVSWQNQNIELLKKHQHQLLGGDNTTATYYLLLKLRVLFKVGYIM
jgi:hypothetical protein